MLAKDVMTTKVVTVKLDTPVSEVAEVLHSHGFSGVPVLSADSGKVLGIISEKDLFAADSKVYIPTYVHLLTKTKFVIGSGKNLPYVEEQVTNIKAKDVLNRDVIFARPDTEVGTLVEIITSRGQNPVPVTDTDNQLLGIVSKSDLIKLLLPEIPVVYTPPAVRQRPVDKELKYVYNDLSSHFAYVAKVRANIWVTVAITLMIVGFVGGIIYTADPDIIGHSAD